MFGHLVHFFHTTLKRDKAKVNEVTESINQLKPGPLNGIRVLDLSRFIAGPLCAQNLGDFGAEVIRLERPKGGDDRSYPPLVNGQSLYLMMYNRNKLGITLDTRHPSAHSILCRLIERSDVIIENYRPGTLEEMSLGWSDIHKLNPEAILTSISGWGQNGPNQHRPAFDAIAQAASGLMSQTGTEDLEPMLCGCFLADYTAAAHATAGTLAALIARHKEKEGQHVDISLVDSTFSMLGTRAGEYRMFGNIPKRTGNCDAVTVPANLYQASDGFVYVHGGSDPLFPKLAQAMGLNHLVRDERFSTHKRRLENKEAIDGVVKHWVSQHTCEEVEAILNGVSVPVAKVANVAEITDSKQVNARNMIVDIYHPGAGRNVSLIGQPIKISNVNETQWSPAPLVGQHNEQVYSTIVGLEKDSIEELRALGVI